MSVQEPYVPSTKMNLYSFNKYLIPEGFYATIMDTINNSIASIVTFSETVSNFLNQMQQPPYITPRFLDFSFSNFGSIPSVGGPPSLSTGAASFPTAPFLEKVFVPSVSIPDFSQSMPAVSFPREPSPLSAKPPEAPNLEPVPTPEDPDVVLPDPPVLPEIVIPSELSYTPPSFDVPLPDFVLRESDLPTLPTYESPEEYESELLQLLKTKLMKNISDGGTGLPAHVEQAIFDREKERSRQELDEAIESTIGAWTSRGFQLPLGVMNASIQALIQKYTWNRLDTSRTIAIEQAKLEQENMKFSLQLARDTEGMLIAHFDNMADKALRAFEAQVVAATQLFKSKVELHNTLLEGYKARITAFEANLRAELASLEAYKINLDRSRVAAEVRRQLVDTYLGMLRASELKVEIYKSMVEATKLKFENQRLQLEIFRGQLDAYNTVLKSKLAEYDIYKATIEANMSKVAIYREQVNAYTALVSAKKAQNDVLIAKAQAQIQNNELEIRKYEATTRAVQAQVMASIENNKARVSAYEAAVRAYAAQIDAVSKGMTYELEKARAYQSTNEQNTRIAMDIAKTNLELFTRIATLGVEASSKVSQFMSALGASSMQVFHIGVTDAVQKALHYSEQMSVASHISAEA